MAPEKNASDAIVKRIIKIKKAIVLSILKATRRRQKPAYL
jgi:hypothetical protein